ncbi:MAG TPA: polysaccharide deacetylase family protein [Burkholderiales bacterium]|nr:polysaccharide deacetylase family protein [Burkholderiales bacterium]
MPPNAYPARFLLTFDDGPSTWEPYNPTRAILDTLARNPVQPGIKAVFFLQTRDPRAGGSEAGRALMRREHAEGHVLAVHSGSPRGHIDHRLLPDAELERTLADAESDIAAVAGVAPDLVRPPFWNYDARTLAAYRSRGLRMLLTDVSANDGVIYFWNISLRRRSHLRDALAEVRERIAAGALPVVDGVIPVVVTFHDTNTFTAHHMQEYLRILTGEAAEVGLVLAPKPFYDDRAAIERAARARAEGRYQALAGAQ